MTHIYQGSSYHFCPFVRALLYFAFFSLSAGKACAAR